jgi:hypothetical protein
MAALPGVEGLRGLPPLVTQRSIQISARNTDLMNRAMLLHKTARINAPAGAATGTDAGPGANVDLSA